MESRAAVLRESKSAQARRRAVRCGIILLMAGILLGPAIWNRFPLLEYDAVAVAGAPDASKA